MLLKFEFELDDIRESRGWGLASSIYHSEASMFRDIEYRKRMILLETSGVSMVFGRF